MTGSFPIASQHRDVGQRSTCEWTPAPPSSMAQGEGTPLLEHTMLGGVREDMALTPHAPQSLPLLGQWPAAAWQVTLGRGHTSCGGTRSVGCSRKCWERAAWLEESHSAARSDVCTQLPGEKDGCPDHAAHEQSVPSQGLHAHTPLLTVHLMSLCLSHVFLTINIF